MKPIQITDNRRLTAKDRARIKILEFLINPDNDYIPWVQLCRDVCHYKNERYLYEVFTVRERREIEQAALVERRKNYSRMLAGVDYGLMKKAIAGDAAAAKLVYQRFEGWTEKTQHEFPDENGKPQSINPLSALNLSLLSIEELEYLERIVAKASMSQEGGKKVEVLYMTEERFKEVIADLNKKV